MFDKRMAELKQLAQSAVDLCINLKQEQYSPRMEELEGVLVSLYEQIEWIMEEIEREMEEEVS